MSRILVEDDNLLVRSAIRMGIETAGHEAVIAGGAAWGLKALDDAAFHLTIVDIFMPHMHGFESVRLFHQRGPGVPLVAIAGFPGNGSQARRVALPEEAVSAQHIAASHRKVSESR